MGSLWRKARWDDFDDETYRAEVHRCLVAVTIATEGDRSAVMRSPLEYDRRTDRNSFLGRRLIGDVRLSTGKQLLCGDRLHPSRELPDVDAFNDHARRPVPFQCMFWRCPLAEPFNARLLPKSPLMDIPGASMNLWGD